MSWTERPGADEDARERAGEGADEQPALTGGQGQVPTKGDIAKPRRDSVDSDERPSDPDVAATTLDSGDPGLGLGLGRPGSSVESAASRERVEDSDVPRDRGGEVAGGAAGAVGGAVVGTAIAGPAGAVIGAIAGAAAGDVAGRSVEHRDPAADASDETQDEADPLT